MLDYWISSKIIGVCGTFLSSFWVCCMQRLLGVKMASFRLHLVCRWGPEEFEIYKEGLDDSDVESA